MGQYEVREVTGRHHTAIEEKFIVSLPSFVHIYLPNNAVDNR